MHADAFGPSSVRANSRQERNDRVLQRGVPGRILNVCPETNSYNAEPTPERSNHIAASACIAFLICVKILFMAQTQAFGSAKKVFNADKKRDGRRCTQMLSDLRPSGQIADGSGMTVFCNE